MKDHSLWMDGGNGCTIYMISLNCTLKNGYNKFYVMFHNKMEKIELEKKEL